MEFGNENVRVRMEVDRISSLPDEIIHHILSFNDTKYAVQTCVLSSRWKLIWTTLPYLKLGTHEFRILPKFSKFVNRVLSLRNHQAEVSSLDLYFRGPANHKFVQKIAGYVASHNVQKVKIFAYELKGKEDLEFPLCFFSSQSLRHLSVEAYCHRNRIFPLPQLPWVSPALTTVELNDVWLCADDTMCLDLFSKCVNLMNLTLKGCKSHGLKLMKIMCPRLVYLSISNCWPSKYEILAPGLSSFYYQGCEPQFLFTGGLNSLEKVNLHTCITSSISNEHTQRKAHEFMNMLGELRSAKSVILSRPVVEFLSKVLDLLERPPSPFYNLKCLRIEGLERPKKLGKSDMTNQVINYFLSSSPTATVSKEYRKEMYPNNGLDLATHASLNASKEKLKTLQKVLDLQKKQFAANHAYIISIAPLLAEMAQRCGMPPPPPPPPPSLATSSDGASNNGLDLATRASLDAYFTSIIPYMTEMAQRCGIPPPPPTPPSPPPLPSPSPSPSLWFSEASSSTSTSDVASNIPTAASAFK